MLQTLSVLILLLCIPWARAQGSYHLFKPVPAGELRELQTDRPDRTESPFTVDPGHFQVEADLVKYSYDNDKKENRRVSRLTLNSVNLKAGLTTNSDFQVILDSFVREEVRQNGERNELSGMGETILRYKYNFYGNEEGKEGAGLIPFVKLPTGADGLHNSRAEGGIMFAFGFELAQEWNAGAMFEIDHARREDDLGWQTDYILTLTLSRPVWEKLDGFIEMYSGVPDISQAEPEVTLDLGFTYELQPRIQLDAAIFYGLTEEANDYETFTGVSVLF